MDNKQLRRLLKFLHEAEGLKRLLRHSWLSNGRRESVTEHSWRLALMTIILAPNLTSEVDVLKVIKMVTIHDLGEVYAGDYRAFKRPFAAKYQLEKEGVKKILRDLPKGSQEEIMDLWEEYEESETEEAKFAKALDKIEVLIQHNEAHIKTWIKKEYSFNLIYGDEYCEYDQMIKTLKDLVRQESKDKITEEGKVKNF